ncbi:MAG: GFA family protein [Janthinobacterium lividum]
MTLVAACHCGDVRVEVEGPPSYLNECQCSVCRRYGALWGYYRGDQVRVSGAVEAYTWGQGELEFCRCRRCGCVSHWQMADGDRSRLAVNGRLFEPGDLEGVPVRQSPGPD